MNKFVLFTLLASFAPMQAMETTQELITALPQLTDPANFVNVDTYEKLQELHKQKKAVLYFIYSQRVVSKLNLNKVTPPSPEDEAVKNKLRELALDYPQFIFANANYLEKFMVETAPPLKVITEEPEAIINQKHKENASEEQPVLAQMPSISIVKQYRPFFFSQCWKGNSVTSFPSFILMKKEIQLKSKSSLEQVLYTEIARQIPQSKSGEALHIELEKFASECAKR